MFGGVGSVGLWTGFLLGILVLLALDLGVFNRKAHRVGPREALIWSGVWVSLSLLFNLFVLYRYGYEPAAEFLGAYVIEKSLSVDNIFVFVVIFRYMKVRPDHLHRVLFAGIIGALVLRAIFILVGLGLINMFSWTLYLFGGFLLYTGIKLLFIHESDDDSDAGENWIKRQAEYWFKVTDDFDKPVFFVRRDGKLLVTTLFVTLLMVETSDVIFALDSIPAIFGVSTDPFIVFSSNVCAVLGLRAMFFLLENMVDRFHLLQYGLGIVLAFVGVKMIVAEGIGGMGLYWAGVPHSWWLEEHHIPIGWSLGFVGSVLFISVLASLLIPKRGE